MIVHYDQIPIFFTNHKKKSDLNRNIFLDHSFFHHFAAHVMMKSQFIVDEISILGRNNDLTKDLGGKNGG